MLQITEYQQMNQEMITINSRRIYHEKNSNLDNDHIDFWL